MLPWPSYLPLQDSTRLGLALFLRSLCPDLVCKGRGVYLGQCHFLMIKKKNCVSGDQTYPIAAKTRKQLQALSRFVNHTIVDKIFGGQLVSTIVCEQCQNSSQIYEPFLDLSLPLVEEKPARPSQSNDQVKGHKRSKVKYIASFTVLFL